jgi:hypothetical protein
MRDEPTVPIVRHQLSDAAEVGTNDRHASRE